MIYFCADDYGISVDGNRRIEKCLKNGVLNKVSVLPNGEISDLKQSLSDSDAVISLHINLIEGYPLSKPDDVSLLIDRKGCFKYSFIGLLFISLSPKRKEVEKQIYKEIQSQVRFWEKTVGKDLVVSIDSHQHAHMIPLVFKTLMRVIEENGLNVQNVRIPAEPISPYLLTPSLYFKYSPVGFVKQWLLKILAFANRKELLKSKIKSAYFMGIMFSGKLSKEKIEKLLPHYLKLAEKNHRDIEVGIHPGYVKQGESLICGSRKGFSKFYYSSWRNTEYDALLNLKF